MRSTAIVAALLLFPALSACETVRDVVTPEPKQLTPQGEVVQVVRLDSGVRDCRFLGTVTAAASSLTSNQDTRLINARNKAGALGASHIVPGRIRLTGEREYAAYRCPLREEV